jgi:hypothetical protein
MFYFNGLCFFYIKHFKQYILFSIEYEIWVSAIMYCLVVICSSIIT